MQGKKNILVTRELAEDQLEYARRLGLNPVIIPAIHIIRTDEWRRILRKLDQYPSADWVFTSRNAAEALKEMWQAEPVQLPERIYAVGEKTAEALQQQGLSVRTPDVQDAGGLSRLIIGDYQSDSGTVTARDEIRNRSETGMKRRPEKKKSVQRDKPRTLAGRKVIHWCGNRSRPELKNGLERVGIELVQMEVYRTILNAMKLPDNLGEAILFSSPSAVEAFRRSGGFSRRLPPLFAIGTTTGEALGLESGENVHIPPAPSTENLLKLVAETLGTQNMYGNEFQ